MKFMSGTYTALLTGTLISQYKGVTKILQYSKALVQYSRVKYC